MSLARGDSVVTVGGVDSYGREQTWSGYNDNERVDGCGGHGWGIVLLKQRREQLLAIQMESILKLWWNNNQGHLAKSNGVSLVYK